ncbi:MAG: hypothetical protein LBC43_02700 [Bifidobacteriaceae bacterium]|nr:hypothetical protein [Bifidobacteriaceae bacterium]
MLDNSLVVNFNTLKRTSMQLSRVQNIADEIAKQLQLLTLNSEVWESMTDAIFSALQILSTSPILAVKFLASAAKLKALTLVMDSVSKIAQTAESALASQAQLETDSDSNQLKSSYQQLQQSFESFTLSRALVYRDEVTQLSLELPPVFNQIGQYGGNQSGPKRLAQKVSALESAIGADNVGSSNVAADFSSSRSTSGETDSGLADGTRGSSGGAGGTVINSLSRYERIQWDSIKTIVKKYHPDFTNAEIVSFLEKLSSEGCGYVAIANSIFSAFRNNPVSFEQTFGFEMWTENESDITVFNFDLLLVDLYSATDNHRPTLGKFFQIEDTVDDTWDNIAEFFAGSGSGLMPPAVEYQLGLYAEQNGLKSEVKTLWGVATSATNYLKYKDQGEVAICVSNAMLMQNGKVVDQCGPHYMTVTGVEGDKLVVSSWGKKYVLDMSYTAFSVFQILSVRS